MYCRALRSACTVLPSTSCFCISPAGARVLQQLPSVKQYGAMPTGSASPSFVPKCERAKFTGVDSECQNSGNFGIDLEQRTHESVLKQD